MKYSNIEKGIFIDRPNRFIAHVSIDGIVHVVHVKNTGRCKELLLPGSTVFLEKSNNPNRKTQYDLVAVDAAVGLVNIDSQAPNIVVKEWLLKQDFTTVIPEFKYGNSRIDFYIEKGSVKTLMEVKGCTLIKDGIGYFPDAPTERGVKHLRELTASIKNGYNAVLAFVIQVEGITEVLPNIETHPEFGAALEEAINAGVEVLYLPCKVGEDELLII